MRILEFGTEHNSELFMPSPLYLNKPNGLGVSTAGCAALAPLLLCVLFEFVVPTPALIGLTTGGVQNQDFRVVILYATTGGLHTLLCFLGCVLLYGRLKAESSTIDFRYATVSILASIAAIMGAVVLVCIFKVSVVRRSYDIVLAPLQDDPRFAFLLGRRPLFWATLHFDLFSLVPLAFVFFGAAVAVTACFWISHRTVDFINKANDLDKNDIKTLQRDISMMVSLISTIFTSSTVSTIIFLQFGRDWVSGPLKQTYIHNGYAMSVFWSCCYTSVILFMIAVPLIAAKRDVVRIARRAVHARGRSFYDVVAEIVSYQTVVKVAAAILMPMITSSVAATFGS